MTHTSSQSSDPSAAKPTVYGSDLIVEAMLEAGIEDLVINPGASVSGLHESIENSTLSLKLALHENIALAMADGYARVTGKPMAVVLHNLVGLQSGAMGIFNAWVNQSPVCIYGGAGPESWVRRRPWIDWIHSAKPQTAAVRNEVKWHAQPWDLPSAVQAVDKGHRIATHSPQGPTYVAFDIAIQEDAVDGKPAGLAVAHATTDYAVSDQTLEDLSQAIHRAKRPVIVADLVGRSQTGFDSLHTLAEYLGAPVVDLAGRHNFDTSHPLCATHNRHEVLSQADLVLTLDCRDLNYAILAVGHRDETHKRVPSPVSHIIDISLRSQLSGQFVDYASHESGAWTVTADTEVVLPVLVDRLRAMRESGDSVNSQPWWVISEQDTAPEVHGGGEPDTTGLSLQDLAVVARDVLQSHDIVVANGDLRGWLHAEWKLKSRLSFLGKNLGAGLGYGSGAATGAAVGLARLGKESIVVNFQNDGDFMYTPQALWTQARYNLPVMTFVVNNGSYGQDRRHSQRLAELRSREHNARPEGIDFDRPRIDFRAIAAAQGVRAWGPVSDKSSLEAATAGALRSIVDDRVPVLIDVHITHEPRLVAL